MPTDQERLLVSLEARIRDFERNMNKAARTGDKSFDKIERRAKLSAARMEASMSKVGLGIRKSIAGFGTVIVGGFALDKIGDLLDASTKIQNALKVTGLTGEGLNTVYQSLFESAQKNAAPLETLVQLYSRASLQQKELGVSTKQLLQFTDDVALALRVQGTDAQTASGALMQLAQALGSGTIHAEEFNSILEGAPTIAQAAAAGLEEAGGSVAKLRTLVINGKVSSAAFFAAFEAGAGTLRDRVAGSETTISQSFIRLQNVLIDTAGKLNEVTDVSEHVADALNGTADAINNFDVAGFVQKVENARDTLHGFLSELGNSSIFEELNKALGITDKDGNVIPLDTKEAQDKAASLERQVTDLQERIKLNTELGFDNTEALAKLQQVQKALATVRGQLANMPASVPAISVRDPADLINEQVPFNPLTPVNVVAKKRVTLADYPITPAGGAGGSGGRHGGGGRRAEHDAARDLIADLEQERALIGATDLEREKANALRRAGASATEAEKQKIGELVTSIYDEEQARDRQQEAMQRVADAEREFVGGLAHDLLHGVSPAEALNRALLRLADTLLDQVLNAIFTVKKAGAGGSGGGFLGALFNGISMLFGGGFSAGGSVGGDPWAGLRLASGGDVRGPGTSTSDSILAALSDGEFVVKAAAAKKHRALLQAINSGHVPAFAHGGSVGSGGNVVRITPAANSNSPNVTIAPTINVNANGGDPAANADLARQTSKAVEGSIRQIVSEELRTAMKPGNIANNRGYGPR